MLFIYFFTILLLSSCTHQPNLIVQTEPVKELALKDINARVLIGSTINIIENNDAKYMDIAKTELSTGQSLWYANWGGWLSEKTYDFTNLNTNINWMKEKGISPQMHMLVGPDPFMPDWLIKGTWHKSELDSLLHHMIYSIMDANDNKDKVDIWNVINELFEDDGTYRTNMVWSQIGWEKDKSGLIKDDKINDKHPIFIRKAFTYCREKTAKKLELRDFNIESNNPVSENDKKYKAIYQLLKHMINEKIPVDAIGIQGHLSVGNDSWRLDSNMLKCTVEKFKALGLEVYITELDARIENQTWTTSLAQKQKQDYYNYIKQAIEGGATRIHFWGIQDGADKGWITTEHPLPWDENFNRKPAYFGIQQALSETK